MKSSFILAPSILSANFSCLGEQIAQVEKGGAQWLHLDIMDNHFVPNLTFGPPIVKSIRLQTSLLFDAHLMVTDPEMLIEDLVKAGVDQITVHLEAVKNMYSIIAKIKSFGIKVGISIKPSTPLQDVLPWCAFIDVLLLMTVEPGFGGQKMLSSTIDKIAEASQIKESKNLSFLIEVDGGWKKDNIDLALNNGANAIVMGSYIFSSSNIEETCLDVLKSV